MADELGIKVGDQVQFSIGGLDLKATVASLREVNWQSLQPNFYVIFDQPLFDGIGASYLTSFYLPAGQQPALVSLLQQYPTFSLVELERTIKQVQEIIAQVSLAIEFILLLVLLAGFLVLMASVQASIDARLHHNAIIRSFGASKRLITGSLWVEFSLLGLLAGLIAVLCSQALLIALQTWLFKQPVNLHLPILLIGPILAALLIACLGYLFTKKVTQTAPLQVLRNL